jgi:putative ABC transport system permease protein
MKRLALFVIGALTPAAEREWVIGDTVEEFEHLERSEGPAAARRWVRREIWRVLSHAPAHRLAVRRSPDRITRARGDRPMSAIWQDVRYTFRLLGRSPAFAAIAIATLAIGIGANTAVFAVVNAVLLKPLPFTDADRLMLVHMSAPDIEAGPGVYRETVWSYPKYRSLLEVQQVFEDTALFASRDVTLAGDGDAERVRGEVVTDRYPGILGIVPILGRSFTYDEAHREGTPAVAMIGYGLWNSRYGRDPSAVGRSVLINGVRHTIIGVLPRGFHGLNGYAELWIPLAVLEPSQLTQRQSHSYTAVAKRKAGIPEQDATAAVRVYGGQVDALHPDSGPAGVRQPWGATAASLYASRADADIRRASLVLLGAVGFVLLIACVNLTNLLLAKAIARRRDVAIRVAIGASRGRIVRQFVVESLVLAVLGAIGGLVVAVTMLGAATMLLPDTDVFFRTSIAPGAPRIAGAAGLTRVGAGMIGLDLATLLFTCAATMVTAVLVAVVPAFQASALPPFETLKNAGSASSPRGFHGVSARTALVAAQIALALILLTGAGLMLRSVSRLHGIGIGIAPADVLTMRLDLPRASYTNEKGPQFFTQLVERIRAIPGVESVGLANCPPVSGGCNGTSIWFNAGDPPPNVRRPIVGIHWATADYFQTLGIRLLNGRLFTDQDRPGQPRVVLVNETAARAFWPNGDPLGKTVSVGQGGFHEGATVVGVVSDVRYRTIETVATPDVYVPVAQSFQSRMRIFVRSRLDTAGLVGAIGREVRMLDSNLPLFEIKTMDERMGDAMWRTRVGAWLLTAFAAIALLLTAIGIFGVMAQIVVQRTPEIGIRMALGAQRRDVLVLVLGRAALVTAVGLAIGVGSALALTRLLETLLYDVRPHDPLTFTSVAVLIGLVALTACYVPARRATRVDAVVALRTE